MVQNTCICVNEWQRKDLNKTIRKINKDLAALGYEDKEPIEIAIELCMYCMKTQVFKDGNKRASVIFANHYLIAQGMGFLVIPEKDVPEFKKLLVQYYEGEPLEVIGAFLKERCWKNFQSTIENIKVNIETAKVDIEAAKADIQSVKSQYLCGFAIC